MRLLCFLLRVVSALGKFVLGRPSVAMASHAGKQALADPFGAHSTLLGRTPSATDWSTPATPAMSDSPPWAIPACVTFFIQWLAWHAPTPRALPLLGFAIGGAGHSESVVAGSSVGGLLGHLFC